MEFSAAEKYHRMIRAFKNLEKIAKDSGDRIEYLEAKDKAEEFFTQCHHFKDWLTKDNSINLQYNVEKYINDSNFLCLCADYCNSMKHGGYDKNRKPRSGKELDKVNTHISIGPLPTGGTISSYARITFGGKEYNAYELAKGCVQEWGKFLKQNGISF